MFTSNKQNISCHSCIFGLLSLAISFCQVSYGAELSGVLRLSGSDAKTADLADAIVYFLPDDKTLLKFEPVDQKITMVRKQFVPRTMAVSVGSTVHIPNDDSISHNAFSPSSPSNFDLDLYGKGESKSFTVNSPGVVRIYCNVHYHMVAYVLGLETPYFTQPDTAGNFSFQIPDAPGQLVIWHERTTDYVQTIDPNETKFVEARLRITKRRLPAHNNKFGGSYRPSR